MKHKRSNQTLFARLAVWAGDGFGSPTNFVMWIAIIAIWLAAGPYYHYSNTWQLMINTPTTIIELFAAILIQYVGNRIERRQESYELKMIEMLGHVEALIESHNRMVESSKRPIGATGYDSEFGA